VSSSTAIPWNELREQARHATATSYAPYSHVTVGACAITTDGRFVVGANVENASYGLTLCAECSLVSDLARVGGGRLRAISIVAGDAKPIAPCGRCRQVLFEHGATNCWLTPAMASTRHRFANSFPAPSVRQIWTCARVSELLLRSRHHHYET